MPSIGACASCLSGICQVKILSFEAQRSTAQHNTAGGPGGRAAGARGQPAPCCACSRLHAACCRLLPRAPPCPHPAARPLPPALQGTPPFLPRRILGWWPAPTSCPGTAWAGMWAPGGEAQQPLLALLLLSWLPLLPSLPLPLLRAHCAAAMASRCRRAPRGRMRGADACCCRPRCAAQPPAAPPPPPAQPQQPAARGADQAGARGSGHAPAAGVDASVPQFSHLHRRRRCAPFAALQPWGAQLQRRERRHGPPWHAPAWWPALGGTLHGTCARAAPPCHPQNGTPTAGPRRLCQRALPSIPHSWPPLWRS